MSRKNSGRKRFSDDQIKSLETTFESESRPELLMKQNLADTLGLHPRQIAIWFQNKRARSKSKQVEKEFNILTSKYHNLASQFEALRKENQSLAIQVQKLRNMSEENEKKNEMGLESSENRDMKSRAGLSDQNREVEEAAGVFDIAEDGCSTFLDTSSLWWEF